MRSKKIALSAVLITAALAAVFVVAMLTRQEAPTGQETLYLRLVTARSESYPATRGANRFARMVSERTNGAIEIEVFSGGEVENDEQAIAEQLSFGAIDIACVGVSPLTAYAPSMRLLELPMLFESREHLHAVLDGEVGTSMLSSLSEGGIVGLAFYDDGEKLFFNSVHSIYSTYDMRDLRLCCRQSDDAAHLARLWGSQDITLGLGEVYRSLQTGRANAADDNIVSYVKNRYYTEANHITTTPISMAPAVLVCSKTVFDTLSDEQQQILRQAAADTVQYEREQYLSAEAAAWEFINNYNAVIKTAILDRTGFVTAAKPVYDECRLNWPIKLKAIEEAQYEKEPE